MTSIRNSTPYWSSKLFLIVLVSAMIPVFYVSKSIFTALAQTKNTDEKKFTKAKIENEPIDIVEILSNGKGAKLNESFQSSDDWLKGIAIKFKNVSGRTITYVNFSIDFPETESTGFRSGDYLIYGFRPSSREVKQDEARALKPGATDELTIKSKSIENIQRLLLGRHDIQKLTVANLTLMIVAFEDGTRWTGAGYSKPDPNNPGKFIPENGNL